MKRENVVTVCLALLVAVTTSGALDIGVDASKSPRPPHIRIEKYNVGNISQIQKEPENFALVIYNSRLPANLEHDLATVTRIANVKLVNMDEETNKKHQYYLRFLFNVGSDWGKTNVLAFFTESNKIVKYIADNKGLIKIKEIPLSSSLGNPFSVLNFNFIGNYVYYFFSAARYIKSMQISTVFSHDNQMYSFVCGVGFTLIGLTVLVLFAMNFNADQLNEKQKSLAGNKVRVSHPTQIVSTTKKPAPTTSARTSLKSVQHTSSSSSKASTKKRNKMKQEHK